MTVVEVIVLVVVVALAAGQLWRFLGPREAPVAPPGAHVQEFHVRVNGGFSPDTIVVETSRAVRLVFHRDEQVTPRAERIKFAKPQLDEVLPEGEATTIEFTPNAPGDYRFRCGKHFGVVIAADGGEGVRANLGRAHNRHA